MSEALAALQDQSFAQPRWASDAVADAHIVVLIEGSADVVPVPEVPPTSGPPSPAIG